MARRVFCIDFGSAYTKVSVRRDPDTPGEVVRNPVGVIGVPDFCFPSAVGVERQGTKNVPLCGREAMTCRPGIGKHLHTNWKRLAFSAPESGQPPVKPPLDALLESPDLIELAAKYGVTSAQVIHLQNLVANARALAAGSGVAGSPEARNRSTAGAIAYHYFAWLRTEVLKACERLKADGLYPDSIPTRLTVPAFADGKELDKHPGCQLLLHSLAQAGWKIHPDRPIVSEPYSNAIGVLTGGANIVNKSRIQIRRMFGNGPFIRPLVDPQNHPAYRALVIDVGAFTTDFATVTLRPEGKTVDDPDAAFTVCQQSVRLGVSDLDRHVFEALPQDKRDWLKKAAEPLQLEVFRSQVYTERKPFKSVEVGMIGGEADVEAMRSGMDAFTQLLTTETQKFCDAMEPVSLQELILTGGGANIPRVREALVRAAHTENRQFVKTHAPGLKKNQRLDGLIDPLKEEMARGGSALGGASIYFEKDFY